MDSEPAVGSELWEDIDEGSLETFEGQIYVSAGLSFENLLPSEGSHLVPEGWSVHRVRVSATGRGLKADELGNDERYLIEMWPEEEPSPPIVHQLRSGVILAQRRAETRKQGSA